MPRSVWCRSLAAVALALLTLTASAGQDARAVVCPAADSTPRELAARVEALGAAGRDALLALTTGSTAESRCGLAGLAAVRDGRVVPLLARAIAAAPADPEVWRLVRWAAFIAGGPEPALATPFVSLIATLDAPGARLAAGDDRLRLLGELDHPEARDGLAATLESALPDGTIDAAIHALARQREPRVRARVVAIGADVANGLAGNATYEQARRLGAVAFYLLALEPGTQRDGVAHLARLSPQDQADTVAWAAQTLCEHGVRHPATRAAAFALRASLVAAVPAGIAWEGLVRGTFTCTAS